jgi:hypothetical protein
MRVRKGLLAGSAAVLVVGLAVVTTTISVVADETATVVPQPAAAGSGSGLPEYLSQQTRDIRPKSHRVDRKVRRKRPSASPTPGSAATAAGTRLQGYVTGYSYWDNTPPGSAAISHPRIHDVAAGAGTYADPITVAVGHDMSSGENVLDWPAGTRFYLPYLHRYFIVEDTCGDGSTPENGPCHTGYPSPAVTWLDVWVGGQHADQSASNACMNAITGVHTVIEDPGSGHPVTSGELTDNCATYPE